jgi:hypothetical protein
VGGPSAPKPRPVTPPPDPNADEQVKSAAAEAKSRDRRRAQQGSMNNTLATSPEGTLGSAPVSAPTMNKTLG